MRELRLSRVGLSISGAPPAAALSARFDCPATKECWLTSAEFKTPFHDLSGRLWTGTIGFRPDLTVGHGFLAADTTISGIPVRKGDRVLRWQRGFSARRGSHGFDLVGWRQDFGRSVGAWDGKHFSMTGAWTLARTGATAPEGKPWFQFSRPARLTIRGETLEVKDIRIMDPLLGDRETAIDVSVKAATFAGMTLRNARVHFSLDGAGVGASAYGEPIQFQGRDYVKLELICAQECKIDQKSSRVWRDDGVRPRE